jgi:hypothetical protein
MPLPSSEYSVGENRGSTYAGTILILRIAEAGTLWYYASIICTYCDIHGDVIKEYSVVSGTTEYSACNFGNLDSYGVLRTAFNQLPCMVIG